MGDQAHRPARLILVKHGMPQIEPERPRSSWMLSEMGRAVAARAGEALARYAPDRLLSSAEPKAAETARALAPAFGLAPEVDPGFGEHRADDDPFESAAAFEAKVVRLFADPVGLVMGEETGEAARLRFDAALGRIGPAKTAVVVAHGRVITLWLSHRLGFDPMPFWKAFSFCHAAVLEHDRLEIAAP
jgi:broad specificity phosphatase PhoE